MKKILAVLMVTVMLFSLSAAAFAATDEIPEFTVDDVDETLYDGMWVTVSEIFDMYLPSDWYDVDVDEAELGDNVLCVVSDEDAAHMVILAYFAADEVSTAVGGTFSSAEELAAELVSEGYTDASLAIVNDLDTVVYTDSESGTACVLFMGEDGSLFDFMFTGFDDDYAPIYANMIYSISVTESTES